VGARGRTRGSRAPRRVGGVRENKPDSQRRRARSWLGDCGARASRDTLLVRGRLRGVCPGCTCGTVWIEDHRSKGALASRGRLVLHLGDRVWRKCREHHDDETSDSEVAAVPAGGSNRGCLRCI